MCYLSNKLRFLHELQSQINVGSSECIKWVPTPLLHIGGTQLLNLLNYMFSCGFHGPLAFSGNTQKRLPRKLRTKQVPEARSLATLTYILYSKNNLVSPRSQPPTSITINIKIVISVFSVPSGFVFE